MHVDLDSDIDMCSLCSVVCMKLKFTYYYLHKV